MADRLSEDGWKELGYEYVIIDDCWMSLLRDKDGRLQPDAHRSALWVLCRVNVELRAIPSTEKKLMNPCLSFRFPGGIAKLADYIHNRGLKLGIYADMGKWTCMGFPGTTLDKIELDAKTFASWGVDYLKFDGCNSNALEQMLGMNVLCIICKHKALLREMVFDLY